MAACKRWDASTAFGMATTKGPFGDLLGQRLVAAAPEHRGRLKHIDTELCHGFALELTIAAGVLVEVLQDVAGALRAWNGLLEQVDLVSELTAMDLVHAEARKFLGLHDGAPLQKAQLSEYLPGVDLLRVAVGGLRVSGEPQHRCHRPPGLRHGDRVRVARWRPSIIIRVHPPMIARSSWRRA
jgi:hypothetical protein